MPFLKILVVEDYEPLRRLICLSLQQRPEFQVIQASNGLEAVQMAKELQPDLILMDIGLPKAEWNGSGETDTQARTPHKTSIR